MTPEEKDYQEYLRFLNNVIFEAMSALGLTSWNIKMATKDGPCENNKPGEITTAYIEVLHKYEATNIFIHDDPCYLVFWKNRKIKQLVTLLCHEVCHILTEPLYHNLCEVSAPAAHAYIHQLNERLVTQIEKLTTQLLPESVYTP